MFVIFHLQPHYYEPLWNCGGFFICRMSLQGESQGFVCVNVAGLSDIGDASPLSIGTVRNSGKN